MGIVFFQNKGFADMCFFGCAKLYSAETAAEKKEALDFARKARQLHGAIGILSSCVTVDFSKYSGFYEEME